MPEEKKKLKDEGLDAMNPLANEASSIMALGYVLPANLVHNEESNWKEKHSESENQGEGEQS